MADDFTIAQGNTWPPLLATLDPAQGQTLDLVGATVRIHIWNAKGDKVPAGPCTILDAVARRVRYDWQPGDTDTKEGYLFRFEATFPGGAVEYFPNDSSKVLRVT